MEHTLRTREVADADADGLVELVGAAYAEYPGCVLDLPGLDADLLAPATTLARTGGRWWVVEDAAGEIVATVAAGPVDEAGDLELKRLYVAGSHRRRGIAGALVHRVEERAAELGAGRVVLWSDTRFTDAHRLYRSRGYVDTGRRRDLHDPSNTTELELVRTL